MRSFLPFHGISHCLYHHYFYQLHGCKIDTLKLNLGPSWPLSDKLITLFSDGLIGMAVVGGAAAMAIGGIVGLGIALSRK